MRKVYNAALFAILSVSILGLFAGFDRFFLMAFLGVFVLSVAKIVHQDDYHTKGRQVIHLAAGIILVYVIKIFGMDAGIILSGFGLAVGLIISEIIIREIKVPIVWEAVTHFERKGIRPLKGLLYYGLGALLTIFIFYNHQNAVFAGILAVASVDSYATGFGTMFGKVEFIHGRSVEGIVAGFLACFFICWTFLSGPAAFTVAIVGTAIDVASLPIDDNLTIPLITAATVAV